MIATMMLSLLMTFNPAVSTLAGEVLNYNMAYADEAVQDNYITVEGPDGKVHEGCIIEVDEPSSHLICPDGYTEES